MASTTGGLGSNFRPYTGSNTYSRRTPNRQTCVTGASSLVTGGTGVRLTSNPRAQGSRTRTGSSSKDKYCEIDVQTRGKSNERKDSISNYLYLAEKASENITGRIKKSLFRHSAYWGKIQAYDSIQSVVRNGYSLRFDKYPPYMMFKNNTSALRNEEFVSQAVQELLKLAG